MITQRVCPVYGLNGKEDRDEQELNAGLSSGPSIRKGTVVQLHFR